ncbi:hypothetical protein ACFXPV_31815 [Streptomyces sp. NPDC059118]|uniref:hypothetical protein n=1 Tax=unclassified Streptomyces TaxID=2593676 RepID=UPI0036CFEE12
MPAVDKNHQRAAARHAAHQLLALTGSQPRVIAEPGAIRIETDVTEHLLHHWEQLLAVLELGTAFGLTDTATGQVAWLSFDTGETSSS